MKIENLLRAGIATVATPALLVAATTTQAAEQPNVLVIILDDAGYNDFGFMGSEDIKTPNIDALASDGVVLSDAHVSATVSGPSRAGVLSGRYQQRGGYECNLEKGFGLDTTEYTIADLLKESGYRTVAVGKWHQGDCNIEAYHPNSRGFDDFYGFNTGSRSYFFNSNRDDSPTNKNNMLQHNGEQVTFDKYLTYELGDWAEGYIRNYNHSEPMFMYLAFTAVHTPMEAAEEDLARFEGHPRQVLAAMTYAVDKAIGGVIDALKESGEYDNTLIFFLSDNGGAHNNTSSNLPLKGFKGNKFEGGHRVPYFVTYGDKIAKGTSFDGLSSSLDIMATSLAAAGYDYESLERKLDGVNLLPYFSGEAEGDPHDILFWRKNGQSSVREGDYKLIEVDGLGHVLYNVEWELGETNNLAEAMPKRCEYLLERLHAWESELVNPVLWDEGVWEPVNIDIHRALMNNEPVKVFTPEQYQKAYGK